MSTVADKLAKKSTRKTGGKQVRVRLVYVDFWSAVKLSFRGAVAIAVVTMVVGVVVALTQTDIKRLMAYSSIAHAGFILTAVVGATQIVPGLLRSSTKCGNAAVVPSFRRRSETGAQ